MEKRTLAPGVPVNKRGALPPIQGVRFALIVAVGSGTTVTTAVPVAGCVHGTAPGKLTLINVYVAFAVRIPVEISAEPFAPMVKV